jgi:Surfeit locus protein 6
MDEKEQKRKRELELEAAVNSGVVSEDTNEVPPISHKRQKLNSDVSLGSPSARLDPESSSKNTASHSGESRSKAEKRKDKRERKKEKEAHQKEKTKEKQKRRKDRFKAEAKAAKHADGTPIDGSQHLESAEPSEELSHVNDMNQIDLKHLSELSNQPLHDASTREQSLESQPSGTSEQPLASSTSSPPPLNPQEVANPSASKSKSSKPSTNTFSCPTKIDIPKVDHSFLQARLQARIDALRAARKADGPDGRPARTRAELIESRRKKADTRKQNKKELRQAAKEEEQKAAAEAELARLRGSGSPMTNGSDLFSPSIPENTSYSFGRIGFGDGSHLGANGGVVDTKKRKGPMDARSALLAAEKKRERINGLDQQKREHIEEKDMWINARKKIHGEQVRDDVSLLKKALKRKEKAKTKSEKDWKSREENVRKSKEAKQKKREANLAKRREEKGNKGKKSKNFTKKKIRYKAFGSLK